MQESGGAGGKGGDGSQAEFSAVVRELEVVQVAAPEEAGVRVGQGQVGGALQPEDGVRCLVRLRKEEAALRDRQPGARTEGGRAHQERTVE